MTAAIRQEIGDPRTVLYKLSVRQYHKMIANGLLESGAPFELLDGSLVRKDRSHVGENPMTVGLEHAFVILRLSRLDAKFQKLGCHVRAQLPITLPPSDEPEPDLAIVRGDIEDYQENHPGPKDLLCVIEVADSSLRRDRTTKLRIYASHGIPHYVIINLLERVAEVYTQPIPSKGTYSSPLTLTSRQKLVLPAPGGKSITISLKQLLTGGK